jgi:monoamine oxidase
LNTDIVIIGGGAAGIAAARRLAGSGLSTVLLEASARLGGRAWTEEVAGLHLDLGCGWLHSAERNAWTRLAEAQGVAIDRSTPQWGIQYRDLGFPKADRNAARGELENWTERLKTRPPGDCAANALQVGGAWNDYIRTIAGFISGASLEKLSAADYIAYDDSSSENNWRVRTGLGDFIVRSFPPGVDLRLATPVHSLELAARGVVVNTPAGAINARAVILTVSTSVLSGYDLELPPQLTSWIEAANNLPLGRTEKLFLNIIDSSFEPETHVIGDPKSIRSGAYYIRPMGLPVIEAFFGAEGARVVDEGGVMAVFDYALGQLATLFGADVRRSLRPLVASRWAQSDRIGGAYSYALPGETAARQALARPFDDRLFFAGEATSEGDFSTVHGAHDTGVRAAEEAIRALRG